mmetsp:Transcript_114905/g.371362  ORF Transcript_114905/g.371362 Transcript_114905/m.371362 type:complete len:233 (+) Transcript_114905:661-1359(+)
MQRSRRPGCSSRLLLRTCARSVRGLCRRSRSTGRSRSASQRSAVIWTSGYANTPRRGAWRRRWRQSGSGARNASPGTGQSSRRSGGSRKRRPLAAARPTRSFERRGGSMQSKSQRRARTCRRRACSWPRSVQNSRGPSRSSRGPSRSLRGPCRSSRAPSRSSRGPSRRLRSKGPGCRTQSSGLGPWRQASLRGWQNWSAPTRRRSAPWNRSTCSDWCWTVSRRLTRWPSFRP